MSARLFFYDGEMMTIVVISKDRGWYLRDNTVREIGRRVLVIQGQSCSFAVNREKITNVTWGPGAVLKTVAGRKYQP
jgi:hypothetical protein